MLILEGMELEWEHCNDHLHYGIQLNPRLTIWNFNPKANPGVYSTNEQNSPIFGYVP